MVAVAPLRNRLPLDSAPRPLPPNSLKSRSGVGQTEVDRKHVSGAQPRRQLAFEFRPFSAARTARQFSSSDPSSIPARISSSFIFGDEPPTSTNATITR